MALCLSISQTTAGGSKLSGGDFASGRRSQKQKLFGGAGLTLGRLVGGDWRREACPPAH